MSDEIKNPNTEEDQPDLMTLEDEDGNEITFEVIDALDHKGVHYLAAVEYANIWMSWTTTNCCWSWASCLKSA